MDFDAYLVERPGEKRAPKRDPLPPNIVVVQDLAAIMRLNAWI